ncbi:pescadillo [Tanacetum coccineum]
MSMDHHYLNKYYVHLGKEEQIHSWLKVIDCVHVHLNRKLCIFKGVFPQYPKKKVKGNRHTYYHMKDILFLKHKPLLEKFCKMRSYDKKVKKAMSKKNKDLAERLLTQNPTYTLDMLIPERYPMFIDALRDLDHCLTMVHPFAALPAIERESIQPEQIHNTADLYALTRYVDSKDRPSRTNDEEFEHRLIPWSNERPLEKKELNAIIGAWFTLWRD